MLDAEDLRVLELELFVSQLKATTRRRRASLAGAAKLPGPPCTSSSSSQRASSGAVIPAQKRRNEQQEEAKAPSAAAEEGEAAQSVAEQQQLLARLQAYLPRLRAELLLKEGGGSGAGRWRRQRRVEANIRAMVRRAQHLEAALSQMEEAQQELALLQAQRLQYLSGPLERAVYRRNHPSAGGSQGPPVSPQLKACCWGLVACMGLCCAAYVCLFSLRHGTVARLSLLASLGAGLAYQLLVFESLRALLHHALLPGLLLHRFSPHTIDGGAEGRPYRFTTFIADSPALLVALRRRDLRASALLLRALAPAVEGGGPRYLLMQAKAASAEEDPRVRQEQLAVVASETEHWFRQVSAAQQHQQQQGLRGGGWVFSSHPLSRDLLLLCSPLLLLPSYPEVADHLVLEPLLALLLLALAMLTTGLLSLLRWPWYCSLIPALLACACLACMGACCCIAQRRAR